jgi:sortase A
VLASAGGGLLAEQAWLTAKAQCAEVLIRRAFAAHLGDGARHRPWSWADTHPVARLEVPRLAVQRTVLAGASGSSLAFGPGHVDGTALPNTPGNCVLAGHRDGSFAFLRDLTTGDLLDLRTRSGSVRYEVRELFVADRRDVELLETTEDSRLTLITCYPFGGLLRSDLRYVAVLTPARRSPGREALRAPPA